MIHKRKFSAAPWRNWVKLSSRWLMSVRKCTRPNFALFVLGTNPQYTHTVPYRSAWIKPNVKGYEIRGFYDEVSGFAAILSFCDLHTVSSVAIDFSDVSISHATAQRRYEMCVYVWNGKWTVQWVCQRKKEEKMWTQVTFQSAMLWQFLMPMRAKKRWKVTNIAD